MPKMTNKQIIEQIEMLLVELKKTLKIQTEASHQNKKIKISSGVHKFSGLTEKIYELIKEGFFDKPKTISDLQKKLKDRTINKPTTSLMAPLKLLITKDLLDRTKPDKGSYKYFKK